MNEHENLTEHRSDHGPTNGASRRTHSGRNPEWTGEQGRRPLPLKGYGALLGIFGVGAVSLFGWAARHDRLLNAVNPVDLAVLAIGSHELARMVSKDRITTTLRQPFTEYEGTEGAAPGEATESARRNRGAFRQAVGELLTCPYCMTTWATTALFGTYLADRRLGRTMASLLSSVSMAEMMQSLYHEVVG